MKITKLFLVGFLFLFALQGAFALDVEHVKESAPDYVGTKIPLALRPMYGEASIASQVTLESGEIVDVFVQVEGGEVKEISFDKVEEADVYVYLEEKKIDEIRSSSQRLSSIKEAIKQGEISYEAKGFWNKLRFNAVKNFNAAASLFDSWQLH